MTSRIQVHLVDDGTSVRIATLDHAEAVTFAQSIGGGTLTTCSRTPVDHTRAGPPPEPWTILTQDFVPGRRVALRMTIGDLQRGNA